MLPKWVIAVVIIALVLFALTAFRGGINNNISIGGTYPSNGNVQLPDLSLPVKE
jgi:hypothetical protein